MSLIVIGILIRVTAGSLLYLAFALSVIPLLVLFVASFFVFSSKRYCDVAPSMNTINWALNKKNHRIGCTVFYYYGMYVIYISSDKYNYCSCLWT